MIDSCYSTGWIIGNEYVGGLIGIQQNQCTVTNCYSTGDINAGDYTGGLTATTYDLSTLQNCYSTSDINASTSVGCVGGLIGFTGIGSSVSNNYALNNKVYGSGYTQRLIGQEYYQSPHTTASSNYAFEKMHMTSDNYNDDEFHNGIDISRITMLSQDTYNNSGWDFTDTWQIKPYALPIMKWDTYPANSSPVANDDAIEIDYNNSSKLALIAGDNYQGLVADTDLDGDDLYIVEITNTQWSGNPILTTGSIVIDQDDETMVSYTHEPDYGGVVTFEYTVSDLKGGHSTALVTIAVDSAPVANDDVTITDEDASVLISVLTNDSDIDGDTIAIESVTQGTNGTAVDNGDGTVIYTPVADFNGADSFTYTINDGKGKVGSATVNVTVNAVNDNPIAVDDEIITDEDVSVVVSALTNDSDIDLDTLIIHSVTQGTNGTVTIDGATVSYVPAENFNGNDSFTYTVADGNGGIDTGTVNVTVNARNDAPVAVTDSVSTDEDVAVNIAVLDNDTDIELDVLDVQSITQGTNGSVTIDGTTVTYTPNANYNGADSFTYTVTDGTETAIGTVNVIVDAVNDAPEFDESLPADLIITYDELIDLLISATDADVSDTLTITATGIPEWLNFADNGDGTAEIAGQAPSLGVYIDSNYVITLRVTDTDGLYAEKSITVEVGKPDTLIIYVDNELGNDLNDGLSMTVTAEHGPFKTIKKALESGQAQTTDANVEIYLSSGSYVESWPLQIDSGKNVNVSAFLESEPIITGFTQSQTAFSVTSNSNLNLSNIELTGIGNLKYYEYENESPVVVVNNATLNFKKVNIFANNYIIFHLLDSPNSSLSGVEVSGSSWYGASAVNTKLTIEHSIINCEYLNVGSPGIPSSDGIFASGINAYDSEVDICNSLIDSTVAIVGIGSTTAINISSCTLSSPLESYLLYSDASLSCQNSILWEDSDGLYFTPYYYKSYTPSDTVTCLHCNTKSAMPGVGNISEEPHFTDKANGDYHLNPLLDENNVPQNPCINTGNNSVVNSLTDLDDHQRVLPLAYGTVDIGCYEYFSYPKMIIRIEGEVDPISVQSCTYGSVVTIDQPVTVITEGEERLIGYDWIAEGDVPSLTSVSDISSFSFKIYQDSEITWKLKKQFTLNIEVEGSGTITGNTELWQDEGSIIRLDATPDSGYVFDRWAGNLLGWGNEIHFEIDKPILAWPVFRTYVANGVPGALNADGTRGYYYMTLTPGWNLVSLPIQPDNNTTAGVLGWFSDRLLGVFAWDGVNQVYKQPVNIDGLQGLWLFSNEGGVIDIPVKGTLLSDFTQNLYAGWNIFGLPYTKSVESFYTDFSIDKTIINGNIWLWDSINSAYRILKDDFHEGVGYWLHSNENLEVIIGDGDNSIWDENKSYIISSSPANQTVTTSTNGTLSITIEFEHPGSGGTVELLDENGTIVANVYVNDNYISFVLDNPVDGNYIYTIVYKDESGNTITTEPYSFVVDTIKPITSVDNKSGKYDQDVVVNFTTSEEADIYYSTDGFPPSFSSSGLADNTTKITRITKASETEALDIPVTTIAKTTGTMTVLQYFAVDIAGNREDIKVDVYRFTDAPLPSVDSVNVNYTGQTMLSWTDSDAVEGVKYRVYRADNPVDKSILEDGIKGQFTPPKTLRVAEVTSLEYTDEETVEGVTYWYGVTAVVNGVEGVISELKQLYIPVTLTLTLTDDVIKRTLGWLKSKQNLDGSWGTDDKLKLLTTCQVLNAFKKTEDLQGGINYYGLNKAITYVYGHFATNNDFLARKIITLDNFEYDTRQYELRLKAHSHYDSEGNFIGAGVDYRYKKDAFDTALVARALKINVALTRGTLFATSSDDGRFSWSESGSPSLYVSSLVHNTFLHFGFNQEWMFEAQQLSDSQAEEYGSFNSNLNETAAALLWLDFTGKDSEKHNAMDYIIRQQNKAGFWSNDTDLLQLALWLESLLKNK